MKKLSAMLLALALVLGLAACGGSSETVTEATTSETVGTTAVSNTCGENLTWELDAEGTLTISGTGEMDDYDEAPWREYADSVYNVVIEEGVTRISDVFSDCYNLTSVAVPASVSDIAYCAFSPWNNTFTSIYVHPENAHYSSDDRGVLFDKDQTVLLQAPCGISGDYRIPDGVTCIELDAFDCCENLSSVTITEHVVDIIGSFENCDNLAAIYVVPENAYYSSDDHGVLYNKDQTILVRAPEGFSGSYRIPDSVVSIDCGAFDGCMNLTDVEIPYGVSIIDDLAFGSCSSLTSITFPASLTWFGDAVRNCYSLREICFKGSAPEFNDYYGMDHFSGITATVYYPANDPSWTEDVRQNYGGEITWLPYTDDDNIA